MAFDALEQILRQAVQEKASDTFFKVGVKPAIKAVGTLRFLDFPETTDDFMRKVIDQALPPNAREKTAHHKEVDFSLAVEGLCRFRANLFCQQGHWGLVLRSISNRIPSLEELGLPVEILQKIIMVHRGLVIVCGVTGSGKSTTIASMLEHVNQQAAKHIITIEDPIEYVYQDKKSVINQREVGLDTNAFHDALKYALRQAPDILLIGEIRDEITAETAIHAAETGHLVVSTLHTMNATQAIERLLNFFPLNLVDFYRKQFSLLVQGIISQRLLRTRDGTKRVPALEILIQTPTIKEYIFEGKIKELHKALKEGSHYGTQTFNQALKVLIDQDVITSEEAFLASDNPEELRMELRGIKRGTPKDDFKF